MENTKMTTTNSQSMVDTVMERVNAMEKAGEIQFPAGYSVGNALRSAWLAIQETVDMNKRPALEVCTKNSIANALLNTVIQGLNPAKKQVYYIVYGDKLQAQRSYFGTMAVLKRLAGVKDIYADVVYEGDSFDVHKQKGLWVIEEHDSKPENIDPSKIKYAYAVIQTETGDYTEIMTKAQIDQSWSKSRSKDQTVHKEFPDQMAKRTVINRACKFFVNSSDDSDLLTTAFADTGDMYADEPVQAVPQITDKRMESLSADLLGTPSKEAEKVG